MTELDISVVFVARMRRWCHLYVLLQLIMMCTFNPMGMSPAGNNHSYVDKSLLDFDRLEKRSNSIWGSESKDALILLGLTDELLYRKASQWMVSGGGFHIQSSEVLVERLRKARIKYKHDCAQHKKVILFNCVITKLDSIDLQEWLVWQLYVVGTSHIIMYLNDPEADNTVQVIEPFVQAGLVTPINMTGSGKQKEVYQHCLKLVRQKVCHFNGTGNLHSIEQNCASTDDIDVYQGKERVVWMNGFDSDEFPVDSPHNECFNHILANYSAYNGLMLPWARFGHSQHFLTPEDLLVTEAYTQRRPDCLPHGFGKAFNRVYFINSMTNGHVAVFRNKKLAVTEFLNYSDWYDGPNYDFVHDPVPRYRLHHYVTKSVEHLIKKWVRGVADDTDKQSSSGVTSRAKQRPISEIVEWTRRFARDWTVKDESALYNARIVREILYGEA